MLAKTRTEIISQNICKKRRTVREVQSLDRTVLTMLVLDYSIGCISSMVTNSVSLRLSLFRILSSPCPGFERNVARQHPRVACDEALEPLRILLDSFRANVVGSHLKAGADDFLV